MARVPTADLRRGPLLRAPRPSELSLPCLVCGKWILDPATAQWFEYTVYGDIMVREPAPPAESQGWFPVGPDCARRIRQATR